MLNISYWHTETRDASNWISLTYVTWSDVLSGITQGSVLGPIFYVI